MGKSYNEALNSIEKISTSLSGEANLIDQDIVLEVQNFSRQFKDNIEDILKENRVLKIGIVGEVKAGKSSFLNAMIFNGEEVLPKAPTPMTAALTKITYADKFSARIVYYNQYDWQIIEERSRKYKEDAARLRQEYIDKYSMPNTYGYGDSLGYNPMNFYDEKEIQKFIDENISKELKACNELAEMVKERSLFVDDYLGQETAIDDVDGLEAFIGMLEDYVGANGRFTPIVKHTEIALNLPILQGIEIIDTPGTNDPIISRGMTTRKFLGQCDVVFLLSYAGQFLSSEDMTFLTSMLPAEGISNAVLIGSKFDSALLDNNKSGRNFKLAYASSMNNMKGHAEDTIKNALRSSRDNATLEKIKDSLPPEFVSSMFYTIGMKNCTNLTKQEQFIADNFKNRFDDFLFQPDFLKQVSNIERVKKAKFEKVKSAKERIISERTSEIVTTKLSAFLKMLEKVNIDVTDRYQTLLNFDKKKLEQRYTKLESELGTVRYNVRNIFEKNIISLEKAMERFKLDLEKAQSNYTEIQIGSREDQEDYTVKTGLFGWKKEHHTRYTTIKYADTNQVAKNLHGYVLYLKENIIDHFDRIIDIANLKKELKAAVISIFDLSDSNFRESEITVPVELVLEKITIPRLTISREKYENIIVQKFSGGVVEGNDIHSLARSQDEVLDLIFKDIAEEINKLSSSICANLEVQSSEFVDNIINKVSNTVSQLKTQLDEKEQYTKRYNHLLNNIKEYKASVKKLMME